MPPYWVEMNYYWPAQSAAFFPFGDLRAKITNQIAKQVQPWSGKMRVCDNKRKKKIYNEKILALYHVPNQFGVGKMGFM